MCCEQKCLRVVFLSLSNPADPYFLAWWLLQQLLRSKFFQDPKEWKLKGSQCSKRDCPHYVIAALKVPNLGKQILMNSYMILLWRRPGRKSFLIVYCALFSLTWFGDCSILHVFQQWQHEGSLKHSRLPSKLKYETLKPVEILSNFQNVKSPCANVKPRIVNTSCRRFWFKSHMLSRDRSLRLAFDS